jgi:methyltransferase (TIGR00027 family)
MFVAALPPIFPDGPTADDDPEIAALEAAFADVVAVRTRFFDDFTTDAAAEGCGQIVIPGAGLDTRAYRLDLPQGCEIFEVDLPDVLEFKAGVLAANGARPRCRRRAIAGDLKTEAWAMSVVEAGLQTSQPVAWILEGLLPYLSNRTARHLLESIGRLSGPGSRIALDHPGGPDDPVLERARSLASMADITAMWRGGLSEDVVPWLATHGWEPQAVHGIALAAQHGRSVTTALDMYGWFVRAVRLDCHVVGD